MEPRTPLFTLFSRCQADGESQELGCILQNSDCSFACMVIEGPDKLPLCILYLCSKAREFNKKENLFLSLQKDAEMCQRF